MVTDILFDTLSVGLAVTAAGFAYFKFFREGTHRQRIEFDIDYSDLGVVGEDRLVEVRSTAENKGYVEQRFDNIRLTIRGIKEGATLKEIPRHEPRLAFPVIVEASLISKKWAYFFVRPGVRQQFPLVARIPANCTHILVRSRFKYDGTDEVHTAERAFQMPSAKARASDVRPGRGSPLQNSETQRS